MSLLGIMVWIVPVLTGVVGPLAAAPSSATAVVLSALLIYRPQRTDGNKKVCRLEELFPQLRQRPPPRETTDAMSLCRNLPVFFCSLRGAFFFNLRGPPVFTEISCGGWSPRTLSSSATFPTLFSALMDVPNTRRCGLLSVAAAKLSKETKRSASMLLLNPFAIVLACSVGQIIAGD